MIDLEEDNILRSIESGISRDIDYLTYETLWIDIKRLFGHGYRRHITILQRIKIGIDSKPNIV